VVPPQGDFDGQSGDGGPRVVAGLRIDVLVASAGIVADAALGAHTEANVDLTLAVTRKLYVQHQRTQTRWPAVTMVQRFSAGG
jgi:hypothetical protein